MKTLLRRFVHASLPILAIAALGLAPFGAFISGSGTASAAPGGLNLQRVPWEGGSDYWAQFAKANAAG